MPHHTLNCFHLTTKQRQPPAGAAHKTMYAHNTTQKGPHFSATRFPGMALSAPLMSPFSRYSVRAARCSGRSSARPARMSLTQPSRSPRSRAEPTWEAGYHQQVKLHSVATFFGDVPVTSQLAQQHSYTPTQLAYPQSLPVNGGDVLVKSRQQGSHRVCGCAHTKAL